MSLKEIDNEVESGTESDVGSMDSYDSEDFLNPDFASILGSQQRVASLKTPTALYGIVVPAGGEPVPIIDDDELPHAITLTMAAIDVSESDDSTKACSIKVIRRPIFDEDEDDEEDIDEEEIAMYTEEYVLCTVKPGVIYQQPLNVTFSEGEAIFFTNTGDCDVHLTGNYMTPIDEPNGQDEYDSDEDYDSEEEENDLLDELAEDEDEEDDLDIDARIQELEEADEATKPSKKRRASSEADLDAVMDDAVSSEPKVEKKLSKKERKKLKAGNGDAVPAPSTTTDAATADDAKKSVSFTKDTKLTSKKMGGGVTVEDRKQGDGPAVKAGSKVSIRYVGKLRNGTTFDSNTKGKPFTFTVGSAECIKGMDIGVVGMRAGSERRVEIPAASAYGSEKLPGIPANSDLIFDIKLLKFT